MRYRSTLCAHVWVLIHKQKDAIFRLSTLCAHGWVVRRKDFVSHHSWRNFPISSTKIKREDEAWKNVQVIFTRLSARTAFGQLSRKQKANESDNYLRRRWEGAPPSAIWSQHKEWCDVYSWKKTTEAILRIASRTCGILAQVLHRMAKKFSQQS